jgi:DNA-binding transcriptional regulator GbsR (MarR family)
VRGKNLLRINKYVHFMFNMIFIILMTESETMSAEHETPVDRAVRRVKAMMMNWGFGEGCSFIYAVLITSHKPLSAEEIGERTNYAYSSTINYLNTLIRMGLVERIRSIRKNLYMANVNFVALIKAERQKVRGYLNQLGAELEGIKDLEHLREKVERALDYLRGVERAVDKDSDSESWRIKDD